MQLLMQAAPGLRAEAAAGSGLGLCSLLISRTSRMPLRQLSDWAAEGAEGQLAALHAMLWAAARWWKDSCSDACTSMCCLSILRQLAGSTAGHRVQGGTGAGHSIMARLLEGGWRHACAGLHPASGLPVRGDCEEAPAAAAAAGAAGSGAEDGGGLRDVGEGEEAPSAAAAAGPVGLASESARVGAEADPALGGGADVGGASGPEPALPWEGAEALLEAGPEPAEPRASPEGLLWGGSAVEILWWEPWLRWGSLASCRLELSALPQRESW